MSSSRKSNMPIVPMSVIMVDYCSTSEEVNTFVENMKNVNIYVDVRRICTSGRLVTYLNASEQHIDIISIAGVRVNSKLTRNTTHIIFENGQMETYRRAIMWNIPLVNNQWFEACMIAHRVCDPSKYPVCCLERYKNPSANFLQSEAEMERKRARKE